MEKIWLKRYPSHISAEILSPPYTNLIDLFLESCEKYQDQIAAESFGTQMTYRQLREKAQEFANFLKYEWQLKEGDRIAIMMPNLLQYLITLYGSILAGLVVVNINPLYTPDELTFQLQDSGAKALVVVANFARTVEKAWPNLKSKPHLMVTQIGDCFPTAKKLIANFVVKYIKRMVPAYHLPHVISFNEALELGQKYSYEKPSITGDDIVFLQYTGGTTGVAKGAVLLHRNIIANIEQIALWAKDFLVPGKEVLITALPIYHIFSLTVNALLFLKLGGHNVLITNPRDIPNFIKELNKVPFTVITGVNTLFNALLNNPDFAQIDFSHLKLTLAGGMAAQEAVGKRWQAVTGNTLIEAYGLTETSPAVSANPLSNTQFNHSIGLPLPSTEVSIRDKEGKEVALGKNGELWVRGPQVMPRYWNAPEETKKVFDKDGWLRTGDVVRMDEQGFIYIVDRLKDMILISGFNVYPNEVEDVLVQHAGVLEAGVIGVPNEGGEKVKAFVVKKDPTLTVEDLINFCREHLTAYKIPKEIEFIDELPKTNVGKILRRALKEKTSAIKPTVLSPLRSARVVE